MLRRRLRRDQRHTLAMEPSSLYRRSLLLAAWAAGLDLADLTLEDKPVGTRTAVTAFPVKQIGIRFKGLPLVGASARHFRILRPNLMTRIQQGLKATLAKCHTGREL